MSIKDADYDKLLQAALRPHFDASETAFIEQQIVQLRTKTFELQFPENKARKFIPLATDIDASVSIFEFEVFTPVGAAKVINSGAKDLPRIEMGSRPVRGKVSDLGVSFGFTINELKEAARVGKPLATIKPRIAREAVERGIDEVLAFGDLANTTGQTGLQLLGLTNNTDVINLGLATFGYWVDGNDAADVMLAEMNALCTAVSNQSNGMFTANALILPLAKYNYAKDKVFSTLSGDSVLQVFKKNNPGVSVDPWEKLTLAGASNLVPRAIAYQKSSETLEGVVPQGFEMIPPQASGLEILTNCTARCGGVKIYQPLAFKYGDFAGS